MWPCARGSSLAWLIEKLGATPPFHFFSFNFSNSLLNAEKGKIHFFIVPSLTTQYSHLLAFTAFSPLLLHQILTHINQHLSLNIAYPATGRQLHVGDVNGRDKHFRHGNFPNGSSARGSSLAWLIEKLGATPPFHFFSFNFSNSLLNAEKGKIHF
jgi:hypothetical protein